ncbi:death domain-associated protein 6 [Tetranychus urticae]|uniref:death domain-associated protein 6 n=1 Tax=Tetranychus urticae TaxID=32264 RepID=UPI00077BE7E3|nr:death domain-associated protein 6 [Tetranychus urticae]
METTEPLEPSSSSGQDVQNPETNGSEPSTANGANTIEARAVTFDQFVETCKTELSDEANSPEQIANQLNGLKEKHITSPIWKNKVLAQMLSHFDWTIRLETDFSAKHLLLHDFKEEFKRADKYLSTLKSKDKKEQVKLMKKIKELQTRIKKDLRKIDRLDQVELSIEDLDKEDSAHAKKEKYEKRVARFATKLLTLQGMNKTSFRILDKVYRYSGTEYPALNEAISSKYRAIMQKKYKGRVPTRPMNSTPNIKDIIDIIKNVSTENNFTIPNIEELALKIADDLIREVQRRREIEFQEMMNDYEHDSHLRPETFADLANEELNKQLDSNDETSRAKIRDIMDTLKAKKEFVEDADIGGDEPQSEEEEEEDPMDALEEDEEISEDEEADDAVDNAEEEDDDDDPVILEEPAKTQNGDSQVPESTESVETKKRPIGSDSTSDEQPKKAKIEESQAKEEPNNSNIENKSEETETKTETETETEILPSIETKEEKIIDEAPKVEPIEDITKEEITEKECIDAQSENSNSSNVVSSNQEKIEIFSNHPKTRSESEDSIKIVDLEAETDRDRSNDEQSTFNDDMIDDDDVICLD